MVQQYQIISLGSGNIVESSLIGLVVAFCVLQDSCSIHPVTAVGDIAKRGEWPIWIRLHKTDRDWPFPIKRVANMRA